MYSKSVVGLANATAAGWGNMGGGVTNLVMPFVFSAIYNLLDGTPARPSRVAACMRPRAQLQPMVHMRIR